MAGSWLAGPTSPLSWRSDFVSQTKNSRNCTKAQPAAYYNIGDKQLKSCTFKVTSLELTMSRKIISGQCRIRSQTWPVVSDTVRRRRSTWTRSMPAFSIASSMRVSCNPILRKRDLHRDSPRNSPTLNAMISAAGCSYKFNPRTVFSKGRWADHIIFTPHKTKEKSTTPNILVAME